MTNKIDVQNDPKYKLCLDHGFCGLVDHMGDDTAIVQAARVSYGKGTKKVSEDRGLIRYLLRHSHTTPFEMCEVKIHAKLPIFIARQWIRHRTANVNEYSARYSILTDEFYIPERENLASQSKDNKQGRSDNLLTEGESDYVQELITNSCENNYATYEYLLNEHNETALQPGIARELARMVLPLNSYTEWYWKVDLWNLMHFLKLRMDSHAQYEIRVYANAIYDLVKPLFPAAMEAFEDYVWKSVKFSRMEMEVLKHLRQYVVFPDETTLIDGYGFSKREVTEFIDKLGE